MATLPRIRHTITRFLVCSYFMPFNLLTRYAWKASLTDIVVKSNHNFYFQRWRKEVLLVVREESIEFVL